METTQSNELTPEQRQRIYLEEKARREICKQLELEETEQERKRHPPPNILSSKDPTVSAVLEQCSLEEQSGLKLHTSPKSVKSNGVAALLSLVIPGAGQMYKEKVGTGLFWFFGTILGYISFIVPGLILHLICIINASSTEVGSKKEVGPRWYNEL